MVDNEDYPGEELPLMGVGERLRRAREDAGKSLAEIAAETRIPQRHLTLIEAGNFDALPARTYAVGFSRSYASAVGLDPREIADAVRAELGTTRAAAAPQRLRNFEPGDPTRVPSRGLALASLAALALLLVGAVMFYRTYFAPGLTPPPLTAETVAAPPTGAPAAGSSAPAAASGPVVFTAQDDGVWVRFYDGAGTRLMEKEMARGEIYTVPPGTDRPQIWTGRPEALAITVGGRPVPRLADQQQVVRNMPVDAAALLARAAPGPASAGGGANAAPTGGGAAAPATPAPAGTAQISPTT